MDIVKYYRNAVPIVPSGELFVQISLPTTESFKFEIWYEYCCTLYNVFQHTELPQNYAGT